MSKLHNMLPFRKALCAAILATLPLQAAAVQQYCSSQNTGSDYQVVTNIYNSNGACKTQCQANYAFAIVQYQNCWCSNYAPSNTESVDDCNQGCPGYPQDKCGNEAEGLFGYIALNNAPSGTAGASSSAQQTSQQQSSVASSQYSPPPSQTSTADSSQPDSVSETIYLTVTQSPSISLMVSYVTPSPTTSTFPTSSLVIAAPSSQAATTTASQITSVQVVTVSGAIVTTTVTSSPNQANSGSDSVQLQRKSGLSGGAIAGIVIGVLAALALLVLIALLLRRRNNTDGATRTGSNTGSKRSLGRNVSVLSKAGLISRGRPSMAETHHDDVFATPAAGTSSNRHSMMFSPGAEAGVSPESPLGSSHDGDSSAGARRNSRQQKVYDQRLNPSALFGNHDNGSRNSNQDQQDNNRPQGNANPDIRASFDSRISRIE